MSDTKERLQRARNQFPPPEGIMESLRRRRDRKRRNQRTRAGVLGLAIAIGVGWLGVNAIRSTPSVPADDPTPTPSPETSVDWESVPGVSIDGDAIVDIRTGEITALPASIRSLRATQGYALSPGGGLLVFEASTGDSTSNPFTSCGGGGTGGAPPFRDCQIFVANVDGTNVRQLTDVPGGATVGGWSPDGTRIVAIVANGEGRLDIDLVLIDVASGATTLVASGRAGDFHAPHFDFGGQRILVSRFQKYRDLEAPYPEDEGSDVYAIPLGGGEATIVFEDRWNAIFSPDGRTIVYERMVVVGNGGGTEVWLADADGSDRRPLVPNDGPFGNTPSWSPDGTRIVFTKHPGDGSLIAVVDVASGTPTFSVRASDARSGIWLDDDTLLIDIH